MAKRIDALKAKQKKQKIVAVVLGVVFLGVMGFQIPRVMKMMKTPPPPHASDTTETSAAPPSGTPSLAAPSLSGAEQPTSTSPADPTAASDTATALSGQLASFSRFASKDPFSQQLSDDEGSSSGAASSGGGSSSGSGGTPTVPQGTSSSPKPGTAVISVNGTLYTVAVSSDFPEPTSADPSATPLFHLVSLTATSAKIAIVGGSYSSGAATVTLKVNKPVTLMNTADGTRYTLVLKPLGTGVPTTSGKSTGSGSSSTPAGTTTTSTSPTTVTLPGP